MMVMMEISDQNQLLDPNDKAARIRRVLNDWDPLGVRSLEPPWPDDEYDCMIPVIMCHLDGADPSAALLAYLPGEMSEHFGFEPAEGSIESVLGRLLDQEPPAPSA